MDDKQIGLLKGQIDKLSDPIFQIEAWKQSTSILLSRIFGANSQALKSIDKIEYRSWGVYGGSGPSFSSNNLESCKKQGRDILEACISELETFGTPEKENSDKGGINITVNQSQTVNVSLLVSALENELTGSQLKELKQIMNSKETPENKKEKLTDKLKSFGKDVATNVLASILTNPNIWG
jgi:hypothetical protein